MNKVVNFNMRRVAEALSFPLSLTGVFADAGEEYKHMGDKLMAVHRDIYDRLFLSDADRSGLMSRTHDIVNNHIWAVLFQHPAKIRGLTVFYLLKNAVEQGAIYAEARSNMDQLLVDMIVFANRWANEGHDVSVAFELARKIMANLNKSGYYADVKWIVEGTHT